MKRYKILVKSKIYMKYTFIVFGFLGILIFVLYFFYSTSHDNFVFLGESESWSVTYKLDIYSTHKKIDKKANKTIYSNLQLNWKNHGKIQDNAIIKYTLLSSSRTLIGETNFSKSRAGLIEIKNTNENIAYENSNELIKLTLEWEEIKEELQLKH